MLVTAKTQVLSTLVQTSMTDLQTLGTTVRLVSNLKTTSKEFGGKDSFLNFSENYPLAVLEKANEELISGAVTNIVSNPELYAQTIDAFFTNLQPQIELAFETYSKKFDIKRTVQ